MRLRAIEREDIATFLRWSKAQEERWFESALDCKDDFLFGIEVHVEDKWVHIGNVGLHRIDWKERLGLLGVVLGEKDYWGKNYGTDSIRTMLTFAFKTLNLYRVELDVFAFNPRAIHCYEKAGFKNEGTRRRVHFHEGQYHDAYYMGILQEEFADHKA